MKKLLATLLTLYLGLFFADASISLADDSLILFFGLHLLGLFRVIVFTFAILTAMLVYLLMGVTPMIPKRVFLPLTLFYPVAALASIPLSIYLFHRIQQVTWALSVCQFIVALTAVCSLAGGFKLQWPPVGERNLGGRGFGWWNLIGFVLVNTLIVPLVVLLYFAVCASLAVGHFSDGFLALRPGGFTVRVREYARNDGKRIRLIPMAHIGESDFYGKISASFPSNSVILMEGVLDDQHLLTNKLSYRRMANSLGLSEQKQKFEPQQGEVVRADVDVSQFSKRTIDFLNLTFLIHSRGLNAQTIAMIFQFPAPPNFQDQLLDDILVKRNQHLLAEIRSHLPDSTNIMVPWGVAHMPGIAAEIQKSGFHLVDSHEYSVIRFQFFGR